MAKTASVIVRMDPELKAQAEDILAKLEIPASTVVNMLYRQIVLQHGIPFDLKIPDEHPLDIDVMSEAELDARIAQGIADVKAGRVHDIDDIIAEFNRRDSL